MERSSFPLGEEELALDDQGCEVEIGVVMMSMGFVPVAEADGDLSRRSVPVCAVASCMSLALVLEQAEGSVKPVPWPFGLEAKHVGVSTWRH